MKEQNHMSNKLIHEKSPYLLQHAYNPVAWHPWGQEAFEKAKMEDKPIFLSIGYSTCHWCHVMEQESFENDRIAEILNREFICVKVDREERPDVDAVYMSVCQAMNGQGGWPLTILMTPECRPFYSGTYFPPEARYGRVGLLELLNAVAKQWKEQREQLTDSAGQIMDYLRVQEQAALSGEPGLGLVHQAYRQFAGNYDRAHGGFGGAPKFPTPHSLMFLMEYACRERESAAMDMAERTLTQMYRGGIYDHIGGGFSRYSTDERWMVPHFEKMLYDNALLATAYVEAYGITGKPMYGQVARKILQYVEAELTDEKGGFYCGQDADSDGVEGKYYVFTPEEVYKVLGEEDGSVFCRKYGITQQGNFDGRSIPNLLGNDAYEEVCLEATACVEKGAEPDSDCRKLYKYRLDRARLHKDDKILVSWNGWMIAACAKAGAVLEEEKYLEMAVGAEAFIHKNLVKNGRLMVRYRDNDAAGEGKLDDYASYALGLLVLYEVTFQTDYLRRAADYGETMVEQFFDAEHGGFYLYAKDGEQLIVRTKETYDGAIPSGNSAAARVLETLSRITGEPRWQKVLEKQLRYMAGAMEGYPSGHSYGLLTMMNALYPTKELVCTMPDRDSVMAGERIRKLGRLAVTVPGLVVVVKTAGNERELEKLAPYTEDYPIGEDAQYYLCRGNQCMPPVGDVEQLRKDLEVDYELGRTV